jgi:hypothetical protein
MFVQGYQALLKQLHSWFGKKLAEDLSSHQKAEEGLKLIKTFMEGMNGADMYASELAPWRLSLLGGPSNIKVNISGSAAPPGNRKKKTDPAEVSIGVGLLPVDGWLLTSSYPHRPFKI